MVSGRTRGLEPPAVLRGACGGSRTTARPADGESEEKSVNAVERVDERDADLVGTCAFLAVYLTKRRVQCLWERGLNHDVEVIWPSHECSFVRDPKCCS